MHLIAEKLVAKGKGTSRIFLQCNVPQVAVNLTTETYWLSMELVEKLGSTESKIASNNDDAIVIKQVMYTVELSCLQGK